MDSAFDLHDLQRVYELASDLDHRVTNAAVAKATGVHLKHIPRMIHEALGMSLQQWMLRQRCFAAVELLVGSDTPIPEIAERVGFCTTSHFTNAFSKTLGIAPASYRRNVAKYEEAKAALMPFQSCRLFHSSPDTGARDE